MKDKKYLTLNQLYHSKKIWWIKSRPTLKKMVINDKMGANVLGTVIVKDRAPRYYFLTENVDKFIKAFNKKHD